MLCRGRACLERTAAIGSTYSSVDASSGSSTELSVVSPSGELRPQWWRSQCLSKRTQLLPEFETASIIDRKNLYGRTTGGTQSLDARAPENKVVGPSVATWRKQGRHFTRHGINSCQIGAFIKVASMASKRQIVDFVKTAMLFRNDVFDVVEQFTAFLM